MLNKKRKFESKEPDQTTNSADAIDQKKNGAGANAGAQDEKLNAVAFDLRSPDKLLSQPLNYRCGLELAKLAKEGIALFHFRFRDGTAMVLGGPNQDTVKRIDGPDTTYLHSFPNSPEKQIVLPAADIDEVAVIKRVPLDRARVDDDEDDDDDRPVSVPPIEQWVWSVHDSSKCTARALPDQTIAYVPEEINPSAIILVRNQRLILLHFEIDVGNGRDESDTDD
jgi:hypothetical protein